MAGTSLQIFFFNQIRIVLVNIYALNDQTQQVLFFKRLQQHLEPFADEHIVVGGDFNCALTEKDKKGGHLRRI